MADLVELLIQAGSDADRELIEKALASACGRSQRPEVCAPTVLGAIKRATIPVRCALLRVAGRIGGPEALRELEAASRDADAAVQDAAIRTLAEAGGLDAAPHLLELSKQTPNLRHRLMALRGYWRLVDLAENRSADDRLKMCETGLAACRRAEETKLGLAELAKVPHPKALGLVLPLLEDNTVRAEAALAAVQISRAVSGAHRTEATAGLNRVLAVVNDAGLRQQAAAVLKKIEEQADYVTAW